MLVARSGLVEGLGLGDERLALMTDPPDSDGGTDAEVDNSRSILPPAPGGVLVSALIGLVGDPAVSGLEIGTLVLGTATLGSVVESIPSGPAGRSA